MAHTNVAAAAVAASALERVQVSIPASHRRKAAPCLRFLDVILLNEHGLLAQSQRRTFLAVISCAFECAPSRQAGGVPLTLRFVRRPATLAARRKARVSAAPSAVTPAWKCTSIHVRAAKIRMAHTNVAAAAVAASALERVQVSIPASHRRKAAPCLRFLDVILLNEHRLLAQSQRRSLLDVISCALECAPGRQAGGVPLPLRFVRRPATLAARRK